LRWNLGSTGDNGDQKEKQARTTKKEAHD